MTMSVMTVLKEIVISDPESFSELIKTEKISQNINNDEVVP